MPTERHLVVRLTSEGSFCASEFSTRQPPAVSVGICAPTLLWASRDMPRDALVDELGGRGWAHAEIERQIALAEQNGAEI
jgi:hypothetical protein